MTCRFSIMRGSPRGADSACNSQRIGKAGLFQTAAEIRDQLMLAAIKMRAATDVEQQAVRWVTGDQWRVAQTPVGNRFEQSSICIDVLCYRIDTRIHGARLRQCQTRGEAEPIGCVIDSSQNFG